MTAKKNIVVSGASGYLGSRLVDFLVERNYRVTGIFRKTPAQFAGDSVIIAALGEKISPKKFAGAHAFIHCAYDFSAFSMEEIEQRNVQGSQAWIESAIAADVSQIIFISSISAFPGCVSKYGKAKFAVEQYCVANNLPVVCVRPGLIYGDQPGGMLGALKNLVGKLGIIPMIGTGKQKLFMCHEDDLLRLLEQIVAGGSKEASEGHEESAIGSRIDHSVPITAANNKMTFFADLLRYLAKKFYNKNLVFVPIPAFFILAGLGLLEMVGIRLRTRRDSLLGLLYSNPNPDFSVLQRSYPNAKFRGLD